LNFNLS